MKEKIKKVISELNKGLVEREKIIKISILTLLAQENLILIGPPGTAKSEISRRLSQVVKDSQYFEYLLTKFTTPEEIFGPLSIQKLKEDKFKRNTDAYLPQANVAFLDEIFKANSAILNSLLTIINEKKFHNGKVKEDAPLLSLLGASNELPIGDNELNALYDRFLVRKVVDYIDDESIVSLFEVKNSEFKMLDKIKFTSEELENIKEASQEVEIPESIQRAIKEIRLDFKDEFKDDSTESFSDRKFVKVLNLLRVSAFTNARGEVNYSDLILLRNCLWSNHHNIQVVKDIIMNVVKANCKDDKEEVELQEITSGEDKKSTEKLRGLGTARSPFLVETVLDLYFLGDEEYRKGAYYFKQIKDIDLSIMENWDPIAGFVGHYDGNNKKIINLKIKRKDLSQAGLFASITEDSSIKNMRLENVDIDISFDKNLSAGSLVAINKGQLFNCYTLCKSISVYAKRGRHPLKLFVGGLVGVNKGKIFNSYVNSNVNSSSDNTRYLNSYGGGLVGINVGEISNSYMKGNVTLSASGSERSPNAYGGGLVGKNNGEISNSYMKGNVTSSASATSSSSNAYGGGLAGENNGEISNSYTKSNIIISGKYLYGGGLVGSNVGKLLNNVALNEKVAKGNRITKKSEGELRDNYAIEAMLVNEEKMAASNAYGCEGKSISEDLLNQDFFERLGWDFDEVWSWNQEKGRPFLKLGSESDSFNLEQAEEGKKTKNELINQIKDNIWL